MRRKGSLFWDVYCEMFPELTEFVKSEPNENPASKFRHKDGGHLLFRPLGLLISVRVVCDLMKSVKIPVEAAVHRVAQVPMVLDDNLWDGLLWDSTNKRIIATSEGKSAARKLMFYAAGGDLAHLKVTTSSLTKELAGVLNKEESEITLKSFVVNG